MAEARGLRDNALTIQSSALPAKFGAGALREVLVAASLIGGRAEEVGNELDLIEIRTVQAIALTYIGDVNEAERLLDPLAEAVRSTGRQDFVASGLGAVAVVRAALGDAVETAALMQEIEATRTVEEASEVAPFLPAIVRAAVSVGRADLAERFAHRTPPVYPYAEHALVTVNAALAEARGETETAADIYADAALLWEGFGVVPEQGFALLGQGRCLLELSRPGESSEVLQQAREIFARCGMRPALEETDALLAKASALSS